MFVRSTNSICLIPVCSSPEFRLANDDPAVKPGCFHDLRRILFQKNFKPLHHTTQKMTPLPSGNKSGRSLLQMQKLPIMHCFSAQEKKIIFILFLLIAMESDGFGKKCFFQKSFWE
jgi:hypothetical protein